MIEGLLSAGLGFVSGMGAQAEDELRSQADLYKQQAMARFTKQLEQEYAPLEDARSIKLAQAQADIDVDAARRTPFGLSPGGIREDPETGKRSINLGIGSGRSGGAKSNTAYMTAVKDVGLNLQKTIYGLDEQLAAQQITQDQYKTKKQRAIDYSNELLGNILRVSGAAGSSGNLYGNKYVLDRATGTFTAVGGDGTTGTPGPEQKTPPPANPQPTNPPQTNPPLTIEINNARGSEGGLLGGKDLPPAGDFVPLPQAEGYKPGVASYHEPTGINWVRKGDRMVPMPESGAVLENQADKPKQQPAKPKTPRGTPPDPRWFAGEFFRDEHGDLWKLVNGKPVLVKP